MKLKSISLLIILISLVPFQAQAIENGEDATGSSFVVPISWDLGNGKWAGCSGTLIAPSIVVTAGHCVLDANGLLTKNVYVGLAGSSISSVTRDDKISAVQITSTFQSASEGKVGDDDLAFLTLGKPQVLRVPIILASEKQIAEFKTKNSTLKSIGYGDYNNSATEKVTYPKSFIGTFSSVNSVYSNSAYLVSANGTSCTGDSGAPILNITATQVTLVGILTGSIRGTNDRCGQKSNDGNYYTLFTLVGRYANLAFSAATDVLNSQTQEITAQATQISDLENQLSDAITSATDLSNELEEARATIAILNKKIPQTILCLKGKLKKSVTSLNPVCPSGYKKK